jgi:hypothetical protein
MCWASTTKHPQIKLYATTIPKCIYRIAMNYAPYLPLILMLSKICYSVNSTLYFQRSTSSQPPSAQHNNTQTNAQVCAKYKEMYIAQVQKAYIARSTPTYKSTVCANAKHISHATTTLPPIPTWQATNKQRTKHKRNIYSTKPTICIYIYIQSL